jgi:hypothetical protein
MKTKDLFYNNKKQATLIIQLTINNKHSLSFKIIRIIYILALALKCIIIIFSYDNKWHYNNNNSKYNNLSITYDNNNVEYNNMIAFTTGE